MAGVVDGDTKVFSLQERADRLRAWRKAWETGSVSEEFTIPLSGQEVQELESPCELFGSVLVKRRPNRQIQIVQIPSKYRNIPKKEWTISHPVLHDVARLAVDHSQRLLIILEEYVYQCSVC